MSHKAVSAAALLLLAGVTAIAVPMVTKDKNDPPLASASAPVPAAAGEATPGADAGGTNATARGSKSKAEGASARLSEKYGDSRTKLAAHLSNEVIGMMGDLMVVMDLVGNSALGENMFSDPEEALGDAAELITLNDEQKAKIAELQAASMKREMDEARTQLAELKKKPEALMEAFLLADAYKRGEITKDEFESARKAADFPKDALDLALEGAENGGDDVEDDAIFLAELLKVLDEEQAKAYNEALAAKKSAKEAEAAAEDKGIMTLEEFEKQITSTRKIMSGFSQLMEGLSSGNLLESAGEKE